MKSNARIFAIGLAFLCAGSAGLAEGPKPFPDFTFKRVKPPQPGETKRITVQIAPVSRLPQIEQPAAPVEKTAGAYDWFWTALGAEASVTGPGRILKAIEILQQAPVKDRPATPRLQHLLPIISERQIDLLIHTAGTQVSPALALAVISVESAGRVDAQSGAGAQGLMQLIPATAERFGVTDSFDASQNIRGGVTYLDWLLTEFDGDPILALAAYNAGEGAVRKHGGVPPFAETQDYVPKVLAAFAVARSLCKTPPVFAGDGCVFHIEG